MMLEQLPLIPFDDDELTDLRKYFYDEGETEVRHCEERSDELGIRISWS